MEVSKETITKLMSPPPKWEILWVQQVILIYLCVVNGGKNGVNIWFNRAQYFLYICFFFKKSLNSWYILSIKNGYILYFLISGNK